MKMTKMSILALAVAFSAAACNNAETTESVEGNPDQMENHHDEDGHMHDNGEHIHEEGNHQPQEMTQTNLDEETAESLTSQYLDIKQALVKSDARATNAAAKNLAEDLGQTEDELGQKILADVNKIAEADGIEDQRKHFESLSMNMYQMNKQVETSHDLYWQHCPMAMDNKGANWISDSKEILNPYFGDKMLKCGRVEEEI